MVTEADSQDTLDMEALQRGDEIALNRLMSRHCEKLFHYLIRILQDESEALDLSQETFVRVYLNRAKFNPKHRFSTWLYTIATNLARDRIRWLSRHRNVSLDAPPKGADVTLAATVVESRLEPDERLEQNERITEIKRAVAALPVDLRTPLVLAEYEDLSVAEISEILKCTPKAIENRLYRARKLLRVKLGHLATAV
jgi:RNA polymerase sigma-70 factor, ECF subfamily